MKVSFAPNISNVLALKKNQTISSKRLNCDTFFKTVSFGQLYDDRSFTDFDTWAKRENFNQHAREIIANPKNYLGQDFEGDVYSIPYCDKWVIKKHPDTELVPFQVKETTYTEIDDASPQINIGQPIASLRIPTTPRITDHYYIHKAHKGGPLGLQLCLMKNVSSGTVSKHIESLAEVATLNQETFDKLVEDTKTLSEIGLKFDGRRPNNLILDEDTKRINITGYEEENKEKIGQFSEVLYALLGSDFADNFNNSHRPDSEKKSAIRYSNIICAKFLISMKNKGCKFEITDNFKKLFDSPSFSRVLKSEDTKEKLIQLRKANLI